MDLANSRCRPSLKLANDIMPAAGICAGRRVKSSRGFRPTCPTLLFGTHDATAPPITYQDQLTDSCGFGRYSLLDNSNYPLLGESTGAKNARLYET